ncbi:ABC transporter ATP-binding protein [Dasania marina]|uniref:ABC transporter ATP-binding protein n=1 Tax=Dasania marina TaxID=471499 RepID=UPI0030DD0E72|tara:strand:+ start:54205 stop:55413 length:1209 start_codon:yes stop_codon:yes gene_type:complete
MNQEPLVSVRGVGKKYSASLSKSIKYGLIDIAADLMGGNKKSEYLRDEEFWAVKDITFDVFRGECFGLVGPNGAGKSSLLKMINGIFMPDSGEIILRGKVAAIMEIGAGFHPLLSGRENIIVSASILGMGREEIAEKLDDIIGFSELGDYIDMPVKNYSSGMYVRLGFSVAIHMDPDVLIMDEVLAVGDVGFRSKCYQAINVLRDKCAIIFVSHSMSEVARVCNKGSMIEAGKMVFIGSEVDLMAEYHRRLSRLDEVVPVYLGEDKIKLNELRFFKDNVEIFELEYSSDLQIFVEMDVRQAVNDAVINISFENVSGEPVFQCSNNKETLLSFSPDLQSWSASIIGFPLAPGSYSVSILIQSSDLLVPYSWVKGFKVVTVTGCGAGSALVRAPIKWFLVEPRT